MKNLSIAISILAILFTISATQINAQCSLGTNRIINGDAEGNPGATGNVDVANWENETNGFTVVQYAATDTSTIPGPNAPGPATAVRGSYLFYGGSSSGDSKGNQILSVTDCATEIDAGNLRFDVNGFFGGYSSQSDKALLTIIFEDAANNILRTLVIGDVTANDRSNVTGMIYQARTGLVPVGTKSVSVELLLDKVGGGSANNGYADNLKFVLNAPYAGCSNGNNRIVNGDAEADSALAGTGGNHAISSWDSEIGGFTVYRYDAEIMTGPTNPGDFHFYGGSNSNSSATSFIDVSDCVSRIDAGIQSYNLSGYFGGYRIQDDRATLNITFLDDTDQTLGTASVGGVTAADRNDVSGMLYRSLPGMLPVGTRTIKADLVIARATGIENNGYADNLSFMLTAPTAAGVFVKGRVLTRDGRGIPRSIVYLTDASGNSRTAQTNHFGYYTFDDVEVGDTYIFNAYSKQYQFQTQVVTINDTLTNLDFIADSQSSKPVQQILVQKNYSRK